MSQPDQTSSRPWSHPGHRPQVQPARAAGPNGITSRTSPPPPIPNGIQAAADALSKADRSPRANPARKPHAQPGARPRRRPTPRTRLLQRCLDQRPTPPPTHPFPHSTLPKNSNSPESRTLVNDTDPRGTELTLADLAASPRRAPRRILYVRSLPVGFKPLLRPDRQKTPADFSLAFNSDSRGVEQRSASLSRHPAGRRTDRYVGSPLVGIKLFLGSDHKSRR